jgi:hypothetical protein
VVSIDVFPDDVLEILIFDFYVDDLQAWQSLVHVDRRWRRVVFGSPNRPNPRLVCTPKTPVSKSVRDTLDVWPTLPLLIRAYHLKEGLDEIIAALERSDRVRNIYLKHISSSDLETLLAAAQPGSDTFEWPESVACAIAPRNSQDL